MIRSLARSFLLLLLLSCQLAAPILADDAGRVNPTADLVATTTTLAAGASRITTVDVGASDPCASGIFGLDSYMTSPSAISLTWQIRCSSTYAGPYDYPVSVRSTTFTTGFATTDGTNVTDLKLAPARYQEFKQTNTGSGTITIYHQTVYKP